MEEAIPKEFQDGWVYKITELKEVLWQFNFMLNCAEWTADKNINMHKMTRLHRPWLITGHLVYHLWYGIENICYNGFRHFFLIATLNMVLYGKDLPSTSAMASFPWCWETKPFTLLVLGPPGNLSKDACTSQFSVSEMSIVVYLYHAIAY